MRLLHRCQLALLMKACVLHGVLCGLLVAQTPLPSGAPPLGDPLPENKLRLLSPPGDELPVPAPLLSSDLANPPVDAPPTPADPPAAITNPPAPIAAPVAPVAPPQPLPAPVAANSSSALDPTAGLQAQRANVAQRLSVTQRVLEASQTGTADGSRAPERLLREVELLKQLDVTYGQQQAALERAEELTATHDDLQGKLEALRSQGLAEQRPYSFLLLERVRDELESLETRSESVAAMGVTAAAAQAKAHKFLEERERERRRAKEAASTSKNESLAPELAAALQLAELESSLAEALVQLRAVELTNEQTSAAIYTLRVTLLREKVVVLAQDAAFTQSDLEAQLLELGKQETELRKKLETAQSHLQYLETKWLEARARVDHSRKPESALLEEIEARRLARQARQQEITLLNRRLQSCSEQATVWQRRYALHTHSSDTTQTSAWEKDAQQALEEWKHELRLQGTRVGELRADLSTLERRLAAAEATSPESAPWLREQRSQIEQLIQLHENHVVGLEAGRRLTEKLLHDIRGDDRAGNWLRGLAQAWQYVPLIWNYEITTVEDRPITIRKLVAGVVLLAIGYWLSQLISRWGRRRFLPRLGVHESAAAALETVAFYVLFCTFTLFALRLVNVPLTAFTVVGGAVAIGVGFGSQNIANNFISGLILLAERPVRVGDTIDLNGLHGTVESIGARSTRLKTDDNLEIIVPNATFLENNVVNLTLTDDRVRTHVSLGVAYGTSTRRVADVLERVGREISDVLLDPPPVVLFTQFGDNAMNFELHFWMHLKSISQRRHLESELRHRIDDAFREAGIVMSFPQRDVHLDTLKPIQISLLPAEQPHALRKAS